MFKAVAFLKRRPGMSLSEFMDYYEEFHAKLGCEVLQGRAVRYMRRYLYPYPNPIDGSVPHAEYDVIVEVWYPDRETHDSTLEHFQEPDIARRIVEDEMKLFDRSKMLFFSVEEHESEL